MRFESLDTKKQVCFLERLHRNFNKELFSGQLHSILIEIDEFKNPAINGEYQKRIVDDTNKKIIMPPRITIAADFLKWIATIKTQRLQTVAIGTTLLHEMIHQYCDENNIDDYNHSQKWQAIAAAHGLHSIYHDGKQKEQWLEALPTFIASRTHRA